MTYNPDRDLVLQLIEAAGMSPPPGDLFLPASSRIDELEETLKEIAALAAKVVNDEDGHDYLFDTMLKIEELASAGLKARAHA